ncbi:MAG: ABC transporter substrate-binding protein [Oscillospiraceae bacterium]|nr:ABC transporter substrate-binding protein [Oscillospiraceae bacterium]
MKTRKIAIALFLALSMLAVLCACGNKGTAAPDAPVTDAPAPDVREEETPVPDPAGESLTRTVTDALGRAVELPAEINAIVPLGNTPRMITYLGLADRVVGRGSMDADKITPLTAYAYANRDLWKDLPIVGTDSMGNTSYYPEDIILCEPDVILCTYTEDIVNDIEAKTGIPVVAVGQGTLFADDYDQALRILAEACGVPERADEVVAYIDACLEDLDSRTADIPAEERPSVLSAAATFKGAHGIEGVRLSDPVLDAVNADNVAAGSAVGKGSSAEVDREQILLWDPDYIFCDYGGVELVRQDMAADPDFYSQLRAYNNGHIYQHPSSTSYFSNLEVPLVNCYFIGSVLYPERFADIDLQAKAAEIYEFFLGDADFGSKLEEYGASYGVITAD